MAKDPAFNFYTNDFDSKTKFFTHEQVGMYLRLLMAQHQHGHLTEAQMMYICGRYDKDVFSKFIKDGAGLFFNDRLELEITKRQNYSESRKKNRKSKKENTSKSYVNTHDNHMSQHMENEYEIENEIRDSIKKESAKTHRPHVVNDSRGTEIVFTKPDIEGDDIHFPIDTKPVRELWASWKKYRWEQHQSRYGMMGEQADLKRLEGLDYNRIEATILAAIANKWKNLYPDKSQNTKSNGTGINKKQQHVDSVKQSVASHYADVFAKSGGKPNG
jgi:hypothetical protein